MMLEGLVAWKGAGFLLDRADNEFDAEVEQDGTQRAALFHAGKDGDRLSGAVGCTDGRSCASVRVADE